MPFCPPIRVYQALDLVRTDIPRLKCKVGKGCAPVKVRRLNSGVGRKGFEFEVFRVCFLWPVSFFGSGVFFLGIGFLLRKCDDRSNVTFQDRNKNRLRDATTFNMELSGSFGCSLLF